MNLNKPIIDNTYLAATALLNMTYVIKTIGCIARKRTDVFF